MSRYHSHLRTACRLIEEYRGGQPFALHARQFFRNHSKHGSSDRKTILSLCYGYFRGGFVFGDKSLEGQILSGFFLSLHASVPVLEALLPEYADKSTSPLHEKLQRLESGLTETNFLSRLFPPASLLSPDLSFYLFTKSLLQQPALFIRLRPGHGHFVMDRLKQEGIPYRIISDETLALPSATKLDTFLEKDRYYAVQDMNSQRVRELFPAFEGSSGPSIWDCCAASGGKSLLAWDHYGRPKLTVSDIRENILHNLERRFEQAGVRLDKKWCIDLALPFDKKRKGDRLSNEEFDLILADLPCSGSGTWARSPEQLLFFEPAQLDMFADRQEKILRNVVPFLAKGKYLLYVTCSVFFKENEAQMKMLQKQCGLQLIRSGYLEGYGKEADTLFTALFIA